MYCNVGQTPIYFSQYMSHHVEVEAIKASVLRVKSQARCDLQNRDFSGFFIACLARAGEAIHMISGSRGILPTDECFMNRGTVALCKRLLETGKWLTLAIGSRYERLIIELHRSANNSIPGGYMVNRKGVGQPLRGSCTSNKKGIYEIH